MTKVKLSTGSPREAPLDSKAGRIDPERAQRHAEGLVLAAIEGNPLTAVDIALLDEHDRRGLSDEESIAEIKGLFAAAAPLAAE